MDDIDSKNPELIKQKLNLDTARINWKLLASYQKEGAVIEVANSLDLIKVATEFVLDSRQKVKAWLDSDQIRKVDDKQSALWLNANHELWAVVVAPWVLVQSEKPEAD